MRGYLKGYYGYKNFGDELLLLGIIPRLFTHADLTTLAIEADDPLWLQQRLDRHRDLEDLKPHLSKITIVPKHSLSTSSVDHLFLGGGEVMTDGRPFPYNGRNYLLRYSSRIISGKYTLLGGIGTPQRWLSIWLRKKLLGRAERIVVREDRSYQIAMRYSSEEKVVFYHDFALDVLTQLPRLISTNFKQNTILLNINPSIRSKETKQKIQQLADTKREASWWFFPAQWGVDDRYMGELKTILPDIEIIDRTSMDIRQIVERISSFGWGIAARLHVLLLLHFLHIPFEPLIYQEKISTFLQTCSDESSSSSP